MPLFALSENHKGTIAREIINSTHTSLQIKTATQPGTSSWGQETPPAIGAAPSPTGNARRNFITQVCYMLVPFPGNLGFETRNPKPLTRRPDFKRSSLNFVCSPRNHGDCFRRLVWSLTNRRRTVSQRDHLNSQMPRRYLPMQWLEHR